MAVESTKRGRPSLLAHVERDKELKRCQWIYLAQHIILLHVVDLPGVDLPFEGVLKELAADVEQQGADRPLLQDAAGWGLVVVAGGWNAVTQNHTHQQT